MFRAAPIAASMAVEETGNDRCASPRGPRCACAMGWARRDRNEMEDGRTGLSCFARNGGVAGRGRKFRTAVATSRARRSRLPVRHAKSRPRWASSVRNDGKRNGPGRGEQANIHPQRSNNPQIDPDMVQGRMNDASGIHVIWASLTVSPVTRRATGKERTGICPSVTFRSQACAAVAGVLLWHLMMWADGWRERSVVVGYRRDRW